MGALSCIFCKIIAGELPCQKVYEDGHVVAILDIHPANKGHVLLIPTLHHENMADADDAVLQHMILIVKKLGPIIVAAVGAQGWNLGVNNGAAAGQMVFHAHWHLIPRFENDGLKPWRDLEYGPGEFEHIGEKIRAAYREQVAAV